MQEISAESAIPVRLVCSGCRHWQDSAIRAVPDGGNVGRCGRFGERRMADARPRCNICWEPPLPSLRPVEHPPEQH